MPSTPYAYAIRLDPIRPIRLNPIFTCILLLITLIVASAMHLGKGQGFEAAAQAIELAILFLSLLFIGPGKYSIDKS